MKSIIFKVSREVVKIIRYLSVIGIIAMILGIFGVLFEAMHQNGKFTLDYGIQIQQVSVLLPISILFLTAIILYFVFQLMKNLDKLLINFQVESYFNAENVNFLSKTLVYLLLSTGVQIVINIISNSIGLENASALFDFSIKNYLLNLMLLIINYIGILVIKHGAQLQNDYDEII